MQTAGHTIGCAGDTHTTYMNTYRSPAHACFLLHRLTHCGTCWCGPIWLSGHPVVLGALPASAAQTHACTLQHTTVCAESRSSPDYTNQAPDPHTLDCNSCVNTPCCTPQPPLSQTTRASCSRNASAQSVQRPVLVYCVVNSSKSTVPLTAANGQNTMVYTTAYVLATLATAIGLHQSLDAPRTDGPTHSGPCLEATLGPPVRQLSSVR